MTHVGQWLYLYRAPPTTTNTTNLLLLALQSLSNSCCSPSHQYLPILMLLVTRWHGRAAAMSKPRQSKNPSPELLHSSQGYASGSSSYSSCVGVCGRRCCSCAEGCWSRWRRDAHWRKEERWQRCCMDAGPYRATASTASKQQRTWARLQGVDREMLSSLCDGADPVVVVHLILFLLCFSRYWKAEVNTIMYVNLNLQVFPALPLSLPNNSYAEGRLTFCDFDDIPRWNFRALNISTGAFQWLDQYWPLS